jgi:hypothetical protein
VVAADAPVPVGVVVFVQLLDLLRKRSVYLELVRCVNAALGRRVEVSNKKNTRPAGDRRIRVRSVRRDPPDIKKLSRALIAFAMAQAQAEADARAEHKAKENEEDRPRAA